MIKRTHTLLPLVALYACTMAESFADAQLDSWLTAHSERYARIYKRASNFTPDLTTTYTTWGESSSTEQADPVYADIQRIQYSTNSVYVEASGLASYVMGPWYKPNGGEYVSWPQNQKMIFRIPRSTSVNAGTRDRLSAGYAGVFVNGMAAYGPLDGKAWADTAEASGQHVTTESDYYWFELAPVEEAFNFDAGNGHQPPTGIYHAHQSPIALRYQLGDHVDYDAATNTYTEKAGLPATHSPIVGWAKDGYPIYGPYGYDDPNDTDSGIRRMVSGYVIRDGSNGTDAVASNLETLPLWYARFRLNQGVDAVLTVDSSAADYGNRPTVGTMALGSFAQDYAYLGDLTDPSDDGAYVLGEDFDLNEQNVRWCKTPEYPGGTYAYFITIDDTQEPTFPYTLGFEYYGETSNQYGDVDAISESVTTHYIGGPNADLALATPSVDGSNDEVTLTWNFVEGGTYVVESSSDASSWNTESTFTADGTEAGVSFTGNGGDGYAQVSRSSIATYDTVLSTPPSSEQSASAAYTTPVSVVYVNAARSGEGTQTGASWATAFADLQDAIATAVAGQEIWVAAGVYYPDEAEAGVATVTADSRYSRYELVDGVALYGGFSGTETVRSQRDWDAHTTILSGDIDQNDTNVNDVVVTTPETNILGTNSGTVVSGSDMIVLDGFTITAGDGEDAGAIVGGGTIRRCVIQGNLGRAGGVSAGEGISVLTLTECAILANTGSQVGGVNAVHIDGFEMTSCRVQGNTATGDNLVGSSLRSIGGVYVGSGDAKITNSVITGNVGHFFGGIYMQGEFEEGHRLEVLNSTIVANYAADTIESISAGGVGANSDAIAYVYNSIIWGNASSLNANVSGLTQYEYNLIEGLSGGTGNLDGTTSGNTPQFLTAITASATANSEGDFRIDGSTPTVDAGDDTSLEGDSADLDEDLNTSEELPLDLAGNARILNGTLDMGAYEYSGPTVASPITTHVEVEVGASGTVDAVNLDNLFGGDYSYSAVVATSGVFTTYSANDSTGQFEIEGPFGAIGSTTLVTVTATDADGYQISTSFTVEITETYIPSDSLKQSLGSWYTDRSSRYARIYETYADEAAQTASTTWDSGSTSQDVPVYGGPQEISYTDSYVFVKTPSLSVHTMGPWYRSLNGGGEAISTNWPANQDYTYKLPRVPSIPATKTDFPGGAIGLMVDGTVIYSSSDAYSWDNNEDGTGEGIDTGPGAAGSGFGDSIWLHEAVVTEGDTFDQSNAHGAGERLHYHGNPTALRYLLGDNMQYEETTNVYTPVMQEDDGFNKTHSPIIGWMNDGLPLYGPFGFSDPSDAESDVRRMVSGFIKRDGSSGSYDVTTSGRDRLPDWVADARGVTAALTINEFGPDVDSDYPVGYFMEDYDFKGDLAAFSYYEGVGEFDASKHFDLNQYNVRFCVTPEFPDGTWAYFTNVDSTGAVVFPNNVAQQYFGDPSNGGTVQSLPIDDGDVVQTFSGGASIVEKVQSIGVDSGDVTLTWSVAEGGTYLVESSTDLDTWTDELVDEIADSESFSVAETISASQRFYRISRTAEPIYDGATGGNGGGDGGGATTFDFTFATTPPLPQENELESVTVGGVNATILSYTPGTGVVQLSFDDASLPAGNHSAQLSFTPTGGPQAGNTVVLNSSNAYAK